MVGLPFLLRLCAFSRSVFTTARDVAGRRIFLATWLPGYLATWLPGYLATWLPVAQYSPSSQRLSNQCKTPTQDANVRLR